MACKFLPVKAEGKNKKQTKPPTATSANIPLPGERLLLLFPAECSVQSEPSREWFDHGKLRLTADKNAKG